MADKREVRLEVNLELLATFLVLRLTGVVDWPWWAVLLPIWTGIAMFVAGVAIGLVQVIREDRAHG